MNKAAWYLVPLMLVTLGACGGKNGKKPPGDPCKGNTDCADQLCHRSVCVPPGRVPTGKACKKDHECYSFKCEGGVCVAGTQGLGQPCLDNAECVSGWCPAGLCAASPYPDGAVPDAGLDGPPTDGPVPDAPVHDQLVGDATVDSTVDAPIYDQLVGDTTVDSTLDSTSDLGCPTGSGCDDGDPKTYDDKCDSTGKCVGKPYPPCTSLPTPCHKPVYDGTGICKYKLPSDVCAIADASLPPTYTCLKHGDSPTGNACLICDAKTSPTALVHTDGKGCVTTVAGTGAASYTDGPAKVATFMHPMALALDESAGVNRLYIVDNASHYLSTGTKIRYLDLTKNTVGTLVGPSGTGVKPTGACQDTASGKKPYFKHVKDVVFVPGCKKLIVSDMGCNALRSIDPTKTDQVTTLAGQLGMPGYTDGAATTVATLTSPSGLAVTPKVSAVYFTDNGRLRLLSGGTVTTVLTGTNFSKITYASASELYGNAGNYGQIYRINATGKSYYLYAGQTSGSGFADGYRTTTAKFYGWLNPVWVGGSSPTIFIAGGSSHTLRKIDLASGMVSTIANTSAKKGWADGKAATAQFHSPRDIVIDSKGVIYIADMSNRRIRKYTP